MPVKVHGMKWFFQSTGIILLLLSWITGMQPGYTTQAKNSAEIRKVSPFQILSTSREGLVVEYSPAISRETVSLNGETYTTFSSPGLSVLGEPGTPQVFRQSTVVGIPQGSDVRITVREVSTGDEQGPRLLPAPRLTSADGLPSPYYKTESNLYQSPEWLPDSLVGVGDIGMLRDISVARIDFHPVRYLPSENRFRIIRRIVIEINFSSEMRGIPFAGITASRTENLYKQTLLNYEQAKSWRAVTPNTLKRSRKFQQTGRWVKTLVDSEGMYRITGEDLENSGISLQGINPGTIRMYNNGGFELPQDINEPRPDGLKEIAVQVTGAEDGNFNSGDAIIFYGRPTSGWQYNESNKQFFHYIHHYQNENVYLIQFDGGVQGTRMAAPSGFAGSATIRPSYFNHREFREDERVKLHESGLEWFGDQFNSGDVKDYSLSLDGRISGSPVEYAITLKGGSSGSHQFTIREGSSTILSPGFFAFNRTIFRQTGTDVSANESMTLSLSYQGSLASSRAYLDWYEVSYRRALQAEDNTLTIYGPDTTGIVEYQVSGFSSSPQVYNVTDWQYPLQLPVTIQGGGNAVFKDSSIAGIPRNYILTTVDRLKSVNELIPVTMSDLRERNTYADFIIIAHDDFAEAMRPYKELKERTDSLQVEIVRISEIYNEFSGGIMDATAIRDFLSFAYDNWRSSDNVPPRYVLLVGDGDYDFKNIIATNDNNWIPPFEIDNDNDLVSRCTDDWYVYLRGSDRIMDMAIGRWPFQSVEQVQSMVEKHIQYIEGGDFGQWRTTFTLVADDELTPGDNLQRIHTDQSENLSSFSFIPRLLNQKKIYLMEYPSERNVNETGVRKPQAQEDFVAQLNRGSIMVSYIGHGNHHVLAHERVFNQDQDFGRIQNDSRFFFFYPATCAFGRYDLPLTQSFAEELLAVAGRGSIGMISSARDVFARQNFSLAQLVYETLFSESPTARVGDALMTAKSRLTGNVINNEKFHLFADPTLRLALPRHQAQNISITPDSLPALGTIKLEGTLTIDNRIWSDFEGKTSLIAFDSERLGQHTMENDNVVTYRLPGSTIFRGTSSVSGGSQGRFTMQFIVPRDITYGGQNGRMSVYYWNGSTDGSGFLDNIRSGGTAAVENDFTGPEISLGFQGYDFLPSDIINPNPVLEITISDPNGINITSEIGHKIELIVDEKTENRIDVSEFFVYNEGSFTEGTIQYPLLNLEEGPHTLQLKAWDNFNNSSVAQVDFEIASERELLLENVLNYPNPFSRNTQFTFEINQLSVVTIKIYSVAGRLIHTFEDIYVDQPGLFATPLWDGRDELGDPLANGVYFYKVIARNLAETDSKTVQKVGKMVIAR